MTAQPKLYVKTDGLDDKWRYTIQQSNQNSTTS